MTELCDSVSHGWNSQRARLELNVTLWNADWDKGVLFISAAVGFNYEYISDFLMPIGNYDGMGIVSHRQSWLYGLKSITGKVASKKKRYVLTSSINDLTDYHRKRKAERMHIEHFVSTPIHGPNTCRKDCAEGVLSVYLTRGHEMSLQRNDSQGLRVTIPKLADLIGRVQSDFTNLRRDVSKALLFSKLNQEGIPYINLADILRSVLKTVLEVEWSTIFIGERLLPEDSNTGKIMSKEMAQMSVESFDTRLFVLSTFGVDDTREQRDELNAHGKWVNDKCTVEKDIWSSGFRCFKGFTSFLAVNPNMVLRKHDVPDPYESGVVRFFTRHDTSGQHLWWKPKGEKILPSEVLLRPANALPDKGDPTHSDHNRIMACSVGLASAPGVTGIVRVIRQSGRPPFSAQDALVLEDLAFAFKRCFEIEYERVRNEPLTLTQRLSGASCPFRRWTIKYVQTGLRHLVRELLNACASYDFEVTIVYLRVRSVLHGRESLAVYAPFPVESSQSPTEERLASLPFDKHACLVWNAVETLKAFAFRVPENSASCVDYDSLKLRFRPVHRDSNIGIVVPFSVSRETGADAVLCVEGRTQSNEYITTPAEVLLASLRHISQTCGLLSCLARNNSGPVKGDAQRFLKWAHFDDAILSWRQMMAKDSALKEYNIAFPLAGIYDDGTMITLWYGCIYRRLHLSALSNGRGALIGDHITAALRLWQDTLATKEISDPTLELRNVHMGTADQDAACVALSLSAE